jgi:hypothetical protein
MMLQPNSTVFIAMPRDRNSTESIVYPENVHD